MNVDDQKRAAAAEAIKLVQPGMTLGLGTGSTAAHFIDLLGEKVSNGLSVIGIPTSEASSRQALSVGIELIQPDETTQIDLAIDGADEVGPGLTLIKGGGGALLREKIIAEAAREFVVIADASKNLPQLGAFPLPVEIEDFAWALTIRRLRETLTQQSYRTPALQIRAAKTGEPFLSDGGNLIVDCKLERIKDPAALENGLRKLPGVIETGLFVGIANKVIIAGENGPETITF